MRYEKRLDVKVTRKRRKEKREKRCSKGNIMDYIITYKNFVAGSEFE
jgi:hypothetical protein